MPLAVDRNTCYIFPPMTRLDKKFFYHKLPPVLYALAIIVVSSIPTAQPPGLDVPNIDKFYHWLEYFIFALLIFRAFPDVRLSKNRGIYNLLLFCFGLVYAALDETVQYFVPNRDSSFGDWTADAIGYVVGGLLFLLYQAKFSKQNRASD